MTTEERLGKVEQELKKTNAGLTASKRYIRQICVAMLLFSIFVIKQPVNGTTLSDSDRTAGGARTYSRSDYADYLRKRDMPEYQQERDTKYRFMTPELIDEYVSSVNPRENIPVGAAVSMQERDARKWKIERNIARSNNEHPLVGGLNAGPQPSQQAVADASKQLEQSTSLLKGARTVDELDNILKSMYGAAYPENFRALEEASLPILKVYNPELYSKKVAAMGGTAGRAENLADVERPVQRGADVKVNQDVKNNNEALGNMQARQNSQEMQQREVQVRQEQQIRNIESQQKRLEGETFMMNQYRSPALNPR